MPSEIRERDQPLEQAPATRFNAVQHLHPPTGHKADGTDSVIQNKRAVIAVAITILEITTVVRFRRHKAHNDRPKIIGAATTASDTTEAAIETGTQANHTGAADRVLTVPILRMAGAGIAVAVRIRHALTAVQHLLNRLANLPQEVHTRTAVAVVAAAGEAVALTVEAVVGARMVAAEEVVDTTDANIKS